MGLRYGWPVPKLEQFKCTMAQAFAMSLPGTLEGAGAALGLDTQKDAEGHRLMLQMCRPRRIEPDGTIIWWDDENRKQRLYAYCKRDVEAERAVEKRLVQLRPLEQEIYYLDQRINDRGVAIDRELCLKAKKVVEATQAKLDAEAAEVTAGEVKACSQTAMLSAWLRAQGVPADSIAKAALEELIVRDDLTPAALRALELRREAAKSSTAKIDQMLGRSDPADGRMRGNLQYHGAGTGRWAARGAQLQNLPRPRPEHEDHAAVLEIIDALMTGDADWVEMLWGAPMSAVADALRGFIMASPNRTLMSADFVGIESRVLAWLAGEQWKLEAFRSFDRGEGPDNYKLAASAIYACSVETIDKSQRQIGKVSELALGYEGGVGAFAQMAATYGLKPAKLAEAYDTVFASASPENVERATGEWGTRRWRQSGMAKKPWLTAELIKLAWRDRHPATVYAWRDLNDAAIAAVQRPGEVVTALPGSKVRYRVSGSFLWCQLPSGRCLCYPYPRVDERPLPWGGTRPQLSYKTVDGRTRKWGEKQFYGGLAAENVTQAVARDLMAEAMLRVEKAGFPVVHTVHDEIVAEPPLERAADLGDFVETMSELPPWAHGCPVTADGWAGARYRKG